MDFSGPVMDEPWMKSHGTAMDLLIDGCVWELMDGWVWWMDGWRWRWGWMDEWMVWISDIGDLSMMDESWMDVSGTATNLLFDGWIREWMMDGLMIKEQMDGCDGFIDVMMYLVMGEWSDWSTDGSINRSDWLTDWSTDWLIDWLVDWLTYCLIR